MQMRHDDGINIKEAFDRTWQVTIGIAPAGTRCFGHFRIRPLISQHRVNQKALAAKMHYARSAAYLVKFHDDSSEID